MPEPEWDAVIVGSGFGGSVLAYRLAEAGLRVCVLERGREYPPNSFARSPIEMRNNFWDPSKGLYGLYNIWSFKGSAACVTSGLGGGSLIYANVLIRKDKEWFDSWPITYADLEPHYERVEKMMNVQQYPLDFEPYNHTRKTNEIRQAASEVGRDPIAVNLAVSFRRFPVLDPEHPDDVINPPVIGEPICESHRNLHGRTRYTCRLCGECDIGCNYGSKNTLDFTYLSEAVRLGARIRTLSEVVTFVQRKNGEGYDVTFRQHHPDEFKSGDPKAVCEMETISCRRLILAAGTMGTTFLLLKNRSNFPYISPALGSRYSTNGDDLGFFTHAKRELEPDRGPVITTAIRYLDAPDGSGFYLEDGGNPYLASWMVELSGVPGVVRRLIRFAWIRVLYWLGFSRTTNMDYHLAQLIGRCKRSSRAMPVLVMGRDNPSGNFTLRDGILDCDWTWKDSKGYYDRVTRELKTLAKAMGAKYDDNPVFRWGFKDVLTAHPLGGCPMGRNPDVGVVDSRGEVFEYPGLYIADGSIMPGPVGPNPSLTIAAFADRVADNIIEQRGRELERSWNRELRLPK